MSSVQSSSSDTTMVTVQENDYIETSSNTVPPLQSQQHHINWSERHTDLVTPSNSEMSSISTASSSFDGAAVTAEEDENANYQCIVCDKQFKTKTRLTKHLRCIHTG